MKIIFFGTPAFATETLKALDNSPDFSIQAIITQPDKAVGRKKTLTAPPVKTYGIENEIPVYQPKDNKELESILEGLEPVDFYIVLAFGMILKRAILQKPIHHCINIHTSILPKYRGASPIQSALLNGDTTTGVSIMKMDEKMDTGEIFHIEKLQIDPFDDAVSLSKKLSALSAKITPGIIKKIFREEIQAIPQVESQASYCKKISKEDGLIDWNKDATIIHNQIRAYTGWPESHSTINGKKIKIIQARVKTATSNNKAPGITEIVEGEIEISCGKDIIIPIKVQPEGKNIMDAKSFLNGYGNQLSMFGK